MKKLKPIIVLLSFLFIVILLVPTILVLPFSQEKPSEKLAEELHQKEETKEVTNHSPAVEVAVYRAKEQTVERIPLEDYVIGVVASEMPADFELEALKAQSLTARTYIVKKMLAEKSPSVPQGANVTDTQLHQVYNNISELKQIWGTDYEWKMNRITEAVKATQGKILVYDNKLIEASFFSTSNGYTENSEDYWQNAIPYLRSVASPWDEKSPKYSNSKTMSVSEFQQKLGVKLPENGSVGKVLSRTDGKRVEMVEINGKKFSGRQIREKLDLKSTDFTWQRSGNKILITTKGYGHGVGMSQYGANGMAEEGKTYDEIIAHYYQGVNISSADKFLNSLVVKK